MLTQIQENGEGRPICYASRSLSETEKRYAVIEKEALAVTWASEKFSDYVLGLPFVLETDHKPLTALLNSTELSKMPPRILRFPPETYALHIPSSVCPRETPSCR